MKYFFSWDCEPEFVCSEAGFKIIKGKNIDEQNGKLIRDFFLKISDNRNKRKKWNWDWNSEQHSSKNRNSYEVNLFSQIAWVAWVAWIRGGLG